MSEPEPTSYMVLRKVPGPTEGKDVFEHVGINLTGRSSDAAIRTYVEKAGDHADGLYVAVPARSWKPVTVKAETQVVLKLEGVSVRQ